MIGELSLELLKCVCDVVKMAMLETLLTKGELARHWPFLYLSVWSSWQRQAVSLHEHHIT